MSNAINVNADPAELEKFSSLAHRWWDPESEFKPLHQINPLRLDWIDAQAPLKGRRVLDVGCGGGILADSMARKGAREVVGIDLATKALRVAQHHLAAVVGGRARAQLLAQPYLGQVADADGLALGRAHDDLADVGDAADLARRADQVLLALALDIARTHVAVVALQGGDDV